jgi:peptide/nickel transport system substrate-binding protein
VQDGVLKNASGEPFEFEILLGQGQVENTTIANLYVETLNRLGITAPVTSIDGPQYRERTDNFDFDMTFYRRGVSLSPGNEQYAYWGSEAADQPGSRNYMGVKSPAIDAMIGKLLNSESQEDFRAATKALDRLLTAGRYVIPFYEFNISRLAHAKELKHPEYIPIYGDWIEWQPDVWYWLDE